MSDNEQFFELGKHQSAKEWAKSTGEIFLGVAVWYKNKAQDSHTCMLFCLLYLVSAFWARGEGPCILEFEPL